MEATVEVAAPSAVVVARLMGSQEGLGSGSVVVGEARWHSEGACSSADRKGELNMFTPYSIAVFVGINRPN